MKTRKFNSPVARLVSASLAAALVPNAGWACACGCSVFDVGTSSMFPARQGWMVFLNYDYQDQTQNWSGSSRAPAEDNNDKEIETHFFALGLQYVINDNWGVQVEVPYDFRTFRTLDANGNPVTLRWNQLADVRLRGIYTGLTPDFSAGLTFGVKLPTGSYTFQPDLVDRDTQLGTGSTDILLGGFYRHNLTTDGKLDWYAQTELDLPVLIQDQYRPGLELDAAAGVYYTGLALGRLRITPIGQVIFAYRASDTGANAANPVASGYERLFLSPGLEFDLHPVKLYADAEFPVYQNFTGDQLAAPVLFKFSLSFMF